MKYIELEAGIPAVEKLYTKPRGALKLKARSLKPLFEAYKEYKEEEKQLFLDAGAVEDENGMLRLPKPEGDMENYNAFIKSWAEMKETAVGFEIKEQISLSSLEDVDISNPEIDVLVTLGIVEES